MNSITLTKALSGQEIKITDEKVLSKLPELKNKKLIVSQIKKLGAKLYCQYFSPDTGCGTLRLTYDPYIEVVGQTDIETLSNFLNVKKWSSKKPVSVTININGYLNEYSIAPDFWQQNHKNIRLKGLKRGEIHYSVPGSSIVKSFNYA